jgi:hypothetical protein
LTVGPIQVGASDYVRELIRADEKRKAEKRLEMRLLEGLQSAEAELTPADWSEIPWEAVAQEGSTTNPLMPRVFKPAAWPRVLVQPEGALIR